MSGHSDVVICILCKCDFVLLYVLAKLSYNKQTFDYVIVKYSAV